MTTPTIDRYAILLRRTQAQFPRFKVKKKKDAFLHILPFKGFTTTIGSTMYVADNFDQWSSNARYATLRHEKIHVEQFNCWPLGQWAWPLNYLLFSLVYLFCFPVLWTMRAKFEREGYTQTMLVNYELHGVSTESQKEAIAESLVDYFGGVFYFFMWRRKAAFAWAMEMQRRIERGLITNPRDRVYDEDT